MFGDLLDEIEEKHRKQEVCKHEYYELKDAYSGKGLDVFFCPKCEGLKHEIERRMNVN